MIRLINIDLDGTLIKDHGTVTKADKEAIKKAMDMGIKVGLNTGRNVPSSMYFHKRLSLNALSVCANGSIILDPHEVVYESILSKEMLRRCVDIAKITGVPFHTFAKDSCYLVGEVFQNDLVDSWDQKAKDIVNLKLEYISDGELYLEKLAHDTCKVSFSSLNKEEMKQVIKYLTDYKDWGITHSLNCIAEVTNKGVNKGSGLLMLQENYNLTSNEVACIGDDTNDYAMFEVCYNSFAMESGRQELKDKAKHVVNSVAKAIEIILGE